MYVDPKLETGQLVLVVEDDLFFQSLVKRVFFKKNIQGVYAENGAQAIILLNTTPGITHLLLDLNMPTMDGYALLEYINRQEKFDHLTVFICSCHQKQHFASSAAKKNLDLSKVKMYFEKPVDFNQLVNAFMTIGKENRR